MIRRHPRSTRSAPHCPDATVCLAEGRDVVEQGLPSLLQFHGDEDYAFCRGFGVPYVKAIGMGNALVEDAVALQVDYPGAAAFLFDSHGGGIDGGSGRAFDWSRIPAGLVKPVILAGGLGIDNVFDAIVRTLPWRSAEHTSELKSLMRSSYAVFCLKKKKTQTNRHE